MKIPTRQQARAYLDEAERLNPGPWAQHSLEVAKAAEAIALRHPQIEAEPAYVAGLLHDIGRRFGVYGMRHVVDGYHFLMAEGHPEAARICLTHSYPIQDVNSGASQWDGAPEEYQFVADFLAKIEYTSYDRLIQLCDALCLPIGPVLMEKRMLDVVMRYGVNDFTVPKWQAYFDIRGEFEAAIGQSIYRCLPGVVKNTFGFEHGQDD